MLRMLIFIFIMAVATAARAQSWVTTKNEPDPFDESHATFIAYTGGGGAELVVRCLTGNVSLLLITGPSNAEQGSPVDVKIVADKKPPQDISGEVLSATFDGTSVQFGDDDVLSYFLGAKKLAARLTLASATQTFSFFGGRPLDDVIGKTRKACGLMPAAPPAPKPTPASNYSATNCDALRSCSGQFACKQAKGDLPHDADGGGYFDWCRRQYPGFAP